MDDLQHPAAGINALGFIGGLNVTRDQLDIAHDGHGILEGVAVDALKQIFAARSVRQGVDQMIGGVDVAGADFAARDIAPLKAELGQYALDGVIEHENNPPF